MDINITVNVVGASLTEMAQMQSQGAKFPMNMVMNNSINYTVKTGKERGDKVFPAVINYDDLTSNVKIEGKQVSKTVSPLVNQKVYAKASDEGHLTVDSIGGKSVDDQTKATLTKVLEEFSSKIKFPNYPIKIGETFEQETPLNLPLKGMSVSATVKIVYKLIRIEGNQAFFDLTQNLLFKASEALKMNISGSGAGTGAMVFGIKESFPLELKSNLAFSYSVRMPPSQAVIKASAKMVFEQQSVVSEIN